MFPKINPTTTRSWQLLQAHFSEMKNAQIKEIFKNDPDRFK
jgi:glucose-6-phosphate isomerase